MENAKIKLATEKPKSKSETGATIRLSQKYSAIIDAAREQINRDKTYKKKISICRYVEKLIEDHWQKPIEDLKKEREGAKDWLEIEYDKESPGIPFFDWVKLRIQVANKKNLKKNATEGEK